ncbi:uncharacterized protein BDR25DRAFT_312447 [Lindgomyces ingoldianus]|uniref:Uncharacterized protein n=1 Tax=Lindgomyces ingoldianus TaxID=673940 RepID=A0ACB6R284_9PLEO|nr:uncharacterized protein BDR25DRAFT_312447 [Lindgomyces ingoldianus]KAF2473364.1 hypothetical protein BDR25DRAFT_312447 [Lindgomyces ingoldianus]
MAMGFDMNAAWRRWCSRMQRSPSPNIREGHSPRPPTGRKRSSTYQPDGSTPHTLPPRRSATYSAGDRAAKRNEAFHPSHHPLKYLPTLKLDTKRVTGPVTFLNPTSALFQPTSNLSRHAETSAERHRQDRDQQPVSAISFRWTSRNNRKGRHALAINSAVSPAEAKYLAPPITASLREIARGIWRMFTWFPVWDISYDVATIFTLGSVVWVINAFFVWLPLVWPETEFKGEELYGGGITAFIGATIFEFGSFLLMVEAVNENRTGCFGWAVERAFSHDSEKGASAFRLRPSKSACTHHHLNKRNLVGKSCNSPNKTSSSPSSPSTSPPASTCSSHSQSWIWFPSTEDLRTHYIHDLGFLASLSQLCGATIFWVSGFTALPGIYDRMSRVITIIFFWTPQVLGGSGFIISGTLFMLETQSHWYKPAFKTLGWWIGAWNLIGGIGFTLCPAFGYDRASWAQYQACLSTFWGSWAFLIGSTIQWYEALDKHPVEVDKMLNDDSQETDQEVDNGR